jgi:hypothetical protein
MGARQVYRDRPSADEIADVLNQRLTATVGTLNQDGSVHLAYVLFLHADGRMFFETSSLTRKAQNALQRRWASVIVQGRAATGRHLMVTAEGTAKLIGGDEANQLNHRLRAKYLHPSALSGVNRAWDAIDDVAVQVTPVRWRSWTGSRLRLETQPHLDMAYEDAWLPDD